MDYMILSRAIFSMMVWSSIVGQQSAMEIVDSSNALDCNKKLYTVRVSNTDINGRTCFDEISVMSCWGRCDSNEVSYIVIEYYYHFQCDIKKSLHTPMVMIFLYIVHLILITFVKLIEQISKYQTMT